MSPDPFFSLGKRKLFEDNPTVPTTPTPGATTQPSNSGAPERPFSTGLIAAVVLCLVVGATVVITKVRKPVPTPEAATPKAPVFDRAWERKMQANIAALDSEIKAAKEAYIRQETFAKSRTISREDDRKEAARLNQAVLDLEKRRAEVAADLEAHRKE